MYPAHWVTTYLFLSNGTQANGDHSFPLQHYFEEIKQNRRRPTRISLHVNIYSPHWPLFVFFSSCCFCSSAMLSFVWNTLVLQRSYPFSYVKCLHSFAENENNFNFLLVERSCRNDGVYTYCEKPFQSQLFRLVHRFLSNAEVTKFTPGKQPVKMFSFSRSRKC